MTSISLLREKFTIREVGMDNAPIIALGNRLVIKIPKKTNPLVLRGHSMHMTLRFAAEVIRQISYVNHVESMKTLLNWGDIWAKLIKPYEDYATPETWSAIYHKGKPIYRNNDYHMFFDILEQCEYKNTTISGNYEKSIVMAQNAFQKMDRTVMIEEESHVGFILDDGKKEEFRFAIILRMPGHKGTFITRILKNEEQDIRPNAYAAMMIAADYIEAINLAVKIGFLNKSMPKTGKPTYSQSKRKADMVGRLNRLSVAISQAEIKYKIHYRPERPDFTLIQETCASL